MAAMEVDTGPTFDEDLLRMYYARLFPYEQMCKWLAYQPHGDAKAPVGTGSTLARRELSLTLADDVYIRYQCFPDAAGMKALMTKRQPHKIDIGAVFNSVPKDHLSVKNFRPEQRELVFDIDLSDYDDVRTCCQGAKCCKKCWQYMTAAVKVCEAALRDDFGFEHIMWVYSGRRGIHCWVADADSRALTNDARLAIIKYFSVVSGNENAAKKTDLRTPLHPSLERAFRLLEPIFIEHVIGEDGQQLLSDPDRWATLLATLPDDLGKQIGEHWAKNGASTTPRQKWEALKGLAAPAGGGGAAKKQKRSVVPELWKYEVVFAQCYPRLDENVSKHRNHLLKSPFAAHPKTGRVCVPFDARTVADFDPTAVVTLRDLARQLDDATGQDAPDLDKTELKDSVRFFEKSFIDPLLKSLHKAARDERERSAAAAGDF